MSGLTDGDSYTFSVTATNSVGTSGASTASSAVKPGFSAPQAPTGLSATPANHRAVLTWTAAGNGGASIVGYDIYEATSAGGENYSSPVNGGVLVTTTSATVSGLTNGTKYFFTVKAVNPVGLSPASNEAWAIPADITADAPQAVTATLGANGSAIVSWAAPLDSGGSDITGYVVTPYVGTTAQTASVFKNNTATTETVTGLEPASAYSFTVVAINAAGDGTPSAPSNVVNVPLAISHLALTLSTAKLTYGHEQSESFSVVASASFGPAPSGTVSILKSSTTLCVIKLASAKGSCSLTSFELPARTFSVYASYTRNATLVGSTTFATKTSLSVAKASTKTSLKLSAAKVTYGNEQLERVSVSVSPEYAGQLPSGSVTITGLACHLTLSAGKGSCTLTSKKFAVGTHSLIAHFWGNTSFVGSQSPSSRLTVVK